jgi:hypothetical protein
MTEAIIIGGGLCRADRIGARLSLHKGFGG